MQRFGATRSWFALSFAALLSFSTAPAAAQTRTVPGEYAKIMREKDVISALPPDVFGDKISMSTGQVEFNAVDISIPGNNKLPVEVRRRYVVEDRNSDGYLGGFGDWDLDVPHLKGTFAASTGWQNGTLQAGQGTDLRCSTTDGPPGINGFLPEKYWSGNTMHIPGDGDQEMLSPAANLPAGPSYYSQYTWTTSANWRFACLATTKNGYPGEGFVAVSPQGERYYFDYVITRNAKTITSTGYYASNNVLYGNTSVLDRVTVFFMASKVEDRFGNTVIYAYQGDRLGTIQSSDGRSISLHYDSSGKIDQVTTSTTSRTYQYAGSKLAQVSLPDGTKWLYQDEGGKVSNLPDLTIEPDYSDAGIITPSYHDCYPFAPARYVSPYVYTITHPSGAVGRFTINATRQSRTFVERVCRASSGTPGQFKYPPYFFYFAVTKKEISGPGLPSLVWTFSKQSDENIPFCMGANSANCPEARTFTVVQPDSSKVIYSIGMHFKGNEGQMLGVKTYDAAGNLKREESTNFVNESEIASQIFIERFGDSPQSRSDDFIGIAIRPQKSKAIAQDGASFSSVVETGCGGPGIYCFDTLARPAKATRSSSSNDSITETTVYHDNTAKWVLGQVRSVTCNAPASCAGLVESQTDYDTATALPIRTYGFGKLLQTLTYYAGTDPTQLGTLASISDGRDSAGFNTTVLFSNWKSGIPQNVSHPATPDQATASRSAVVRDDGNISLFDDENDFRTCYGYDPMERLAAVIYPSETAAETCDASYWKNTTLTFAPSTENNFGLPIGHWKQSVKTGDGTRIVHFDALWRPVVEESFDNGSATLATNTHSYVVKRYDLSGNLMFQSYPSRTLSDYATVTAGVTTTYDTLDRITKTSTPSVDSGTGKFITTTSYLSDASGPYTQAVDARNNVTKTWFQMFDQPDYSRPVKITQPEGVITDIARDVFGKPTSMTRHDASNSVVSTRTYAYNASQELCRTAEPETGATLMGYDAAGNLAWSAAGYASTAACGGPENVAARRVDRTYDARNRLKTLVFPDHLGDTTTTYTPDGLVASLAADNGSSNVVTTAYTYNRRRLLIGERMTWNAINWPIVYGYDANGNAANLTYPDSTYVDYAPNALGQATKVGTYATNVTYHPNGAIAQFSYGNGIVHAMTQNDRQLPDRSRDAFDGAPAVVSLDDNYSYDGNGNVVAILDGIAGAPSDRTMEYDGLNRLTKATSPLFNDGTANEARYSYDVLDNISTVHMRDRNQFYCYDTATWRLTNIKTGYCSSGATVVGLGYDVQGNVTNKNGQMFAFDFGNRLRSTSNNSTPVSSYVYDGLGRRVRDYTTASKYSLYSKDGRIVYASDGRAGKVTTNVYLGNSLLAELEKDTATAAVTTRYMHTDALGSVVALSNTSRYLNRNSYEPYGELINRSNYDRPGFAGHVMDTVTDLTYMQQRYYDADIGRFVSVDPVAVNAGSNANFNRYWYANNNPYKFTDPDGREAGCVTLQVDCFDSGGTLKEKMAAMGGFAALTVAGLFAPQAIPFVAKGLAPKVTVGAAKQIVGEARENLVAKLTQGIVSGEKITAKNLGSTDIDVISKAGDLIAVGGPAKAGNLSNLSRVLRIYSAEAKTRGVGAKAFFEKGTPEKAIDLAKKILGKDNVKVFE